MRSQAPQILAVVLFVATTGCVKPFLITDFGTTYQPRTQSVAVAPLANLSPEPEGSQAAAAIRDAVYFELSRRQDRYTVTIQDIAQTGKLIHDAGLTDSAAAVMPGPDLARLLGVDAVMRGNVTRYKKSGAAGQVVTAVLFGFAKGSEVQADVAIYDGTDGRMIWQHNITKAGGFLSSPDGLRKNVGRDIANKFPYKKPS